MPQIVPVPKRCTRCRQARSRDEFSADRSRPDGLQPWCKPCKAAWRRASRAALTAYQRDWRRARAA